MKPSASSDCSNGGSTATMSSTTASLMAIIPRGLNVLARDRQPHRPALMLIALVV
jgi:hypothetical protein